MNSLGLDDYINEFESFCKKRKLEYKRNDRGVSIKSTAGVYNIHIYMNWDAFDRVIIGFIIGASIYEVNNTSRLENNLGYVSDMSAIRAYLQNIYPDWLTSNKTWKSKSKYK